MNVLEQLIRGDGSSLTELTQERVQRDLNEFFLVGATFTKVVVSSSGECVSQVECRCEGIVAEQWQDTLGTDGSLTITTADGEQDIRLLYGADVLTGKTFAVFYLPSRLGHLCLEEIIVCRKH